VADDTPSAADSLSEAQAKTLAQGNADAVAPCPLAKHWIEVKLQDDDGNPIPGEEYVILGPEGGKYSGSLDDNGFVRIDGLAAGTCEVRFPRLYQRYRPELMSN
jgi:hypothetical protein